MLQLLRDYIERLLRFRSSGVSRPWIDVIFSEFIADPLCAVEHIYESADIALTPAARDGMAQWVKAHPREDLRRARPADLGPYGIDPAVARAAFLEYCEAFDVPFDGI